VLQPQLEVSYSKPEPARLGLGMKKSDYSRHALANMSQGERRQESAEEPHQAFALQPEKQLFQPLFGPTAGQLTAPMVLLE